MNATINATKLDQLLAELNQKRHLRLEEIKQNCQTRIESLEQKMKKGFETKTKKRQQDEFSHLHQLENRAIRETRVQQQQTLWNCQMACIEQTLCEARRSLSQQPLDKQSLLNWIEEARKRLGQPKKLLLKVKPQWAEQIETIEIPLTTTEMLGGAVLLDAEKQIELDGSWDQRLEALMPQLWQRWYRNVSSNNQD